MQKMMKPMIRTVELESILVTPDIAAAWLDKNTGNRPIKRSVVENYASDMTAGRWLLTGDPIRFSTDGILLDGQHRLLACIKSGVPFASAVIYGLPPETRPVLDIGARRTAADVLHWQGHHRSKQIAAAARVLLEIKEPGRIAHSQPHVIEFVGRHQGLVISAERIFGVHRALSPSVATAVHYVGCLLGDHAKAEAMVAVLKTGLPSYPGDPMQLLRERLIGDAANRHPMKKQFVIANYINTWNHFRADRTLIKMMTPKSGRASFDGLNVETML